MARKCNKLAGLDPVIKSAILRCKQKSRELDRKFAPILKKKVKNVKKTSKKRSKTKPGKARLTKQGGQSPQYSEIVEMKNELYTSSKPDVLRYEISKVVCWNYSNDTERTKRKAKSEPSNFTPNVEKTKISREGSKYLASTSKPGTSKMSVGRSRPMRRKSKEKRRRKKSKSLRSRLIRLNNILSYIRSRTVENEYANGDHGLPSLEEMANFGMKPNSRKKKPRKIRREIKKKIVEKPNPVPKVKKLKSLVPVKLKTNLKAKKCQDLRRKIGPVPIVKVKPPNTEDEEVLQEFIVKNLKKDPLFLLKCVLKKDFSKNTMVQILTTLAMAGFKSAQKRRFRRYKKAEEIRINNPQDPTTKSVNYLKEIKQKESFFKVLGAILDKIQRNGQERAMRFPNTSSYESCEFRQIIEGANKMSDCAIFVSSFRNRLDNDREIEFGSVLSVDIGRYAKPKREIDEDSEDDFQDALSRFDSE